ncbi:hypothetical protein ACFLQ2_00990 [archaeon]
MDLDSEQIILLGAVCVAVYLAGYGSLAIGIFILLIISSVVMGGKKVIKPKGTSMGGVRIKGAEALEPIIIETTRGAPFRIPANMNVRVRSNWGGQTWIEKAMGKGAGRAARMMYRSTGRSQY